MPRFRIDRRTRKVYPIPSPTEDVPTYYFPHPLTEGDIMELLDSRGTPEEETTQILEELREMGYSIALGVGEKQPRRIFVYPIEITDFIRKQFRKGITEKTVVKKVASILGRDSQTVAENWVEWVHTLSGEIGPQTLTGEEKGGQLRGFDALAQQQAGFRKFVRGQAPS